MSRKPTPLEQFEAAATLAASLPTPQRISRAILASTPDVDDGLRAANYDGDRVKGGRAENSHPERQLAARNPGQFPKDHENPDKRGVWDTGRKHNSRPSDDLYRLSKASERAVDAIASLAAICRDAAPPDTWDDIAWHCSVLLGERCDDPSHEPGDHELGAGNPHDCQTLNTLTEALDIDRNAGVWVDRFTAAIDTVRAIRDTWMAHDAPKGLAETNQPYCRPCRRLKDYKGDSLLRPRVTKVCCHRCWRDIQDLEGFILDGDGKPIPAVVLQEDPAMWPTEAMTKAREDGRRVLFEKERQAWLRSHGVDVQRAHQRRQDRRSA